jgi:agmatinase
MTVTLLGVPYDAASSFLRGAAEAPARIRRVLHSPAGNLWTELGADLGAPGALADAGDLTFPDEADSAAAREAITAGVAAVLAQGHRPLILGGDHAVTFPVLQAVHAAHGPLTVLHLDAHPDLYDEFEGDRYSHACSFARIMEAGLARRLVQVGIRAATGHQREQARRFGVETIDMTAWAAGARPRVEAPLYVSLDLDGLDPAFAPGVSHREPGGLTVRDVIGLLHGLPAPFVAADLVEFNPRRDLDGVTAAVAAKLLKELAGVMARD